MVADRCGSAIPVVTIIYLSNLFYQDSICVFGISTGMVVCVSSGYLTLIEVFFSHSIEL
jgi:hypothetical protein